MLSGSIDPSGHWKAWVVPTDIYKVPLPPLGTEQQLSASLGDSDMEESLLLIIHVVNLSPNLIELWPFSAALALFTLPMTRLNYSGSSQPPAHIYRPIQEQVSGASAPSSIETGTYSTYSLTSHSISLLFGCRLRSACPASPQSLSAFRSPSLSNHVRSNPDTFWNSSLLSVSAFHLP